MSAMQANVAQRVFEANRDSSAAKEPSVQQKHDLPNDANPWCTALHHLVSQIYGDGLQCGAVAPKWWCESDTSFMEDEEQRRGLPRGALWPLLDLPYYNAITMTEYTTKDKQPVLLLGTGEQFDEWEAYSICYIKAGEKANSGGVAASPALQCGERVHVGEYLDQKLTFVRVLRARKPAGLASEAKTQQCFYALLHNHSGFHYAPLHEVLPMCSQFAGMYDWLEEHPNELAFEGSPLPGMLLMHPFKVKSVAAVAKAAPIYIKRVRKEFQIGVKRAFDHLDIINIHVLLPYQVL